MGEEGEAGKLVGRMYKVTIRLDVECYSVVRIGEEGRNHRNCDTIAAECCSAMISVSRKYSRKASDSHRKRWRMNDDVQPCWKRSTAAMMRRLWVL